MSASATNAGSSSDLPKKSENPFVGPRSIPKGKPLFGRDREVRDLYRVLVADRIVLLHAPSGAGKSSLVNAGLIPRLEASRTHRRGYTVWPIVRLNTEPPADRQAGGRDRYTLSALSMLAAERVKQGADALDVLRGMSFCDFFAAHADGGLEATEQVLIFDQFEEVLTTDPNDTAGKEAFFEGLGRLLKYPGFHALFSIRDEFVGALEPYRKLIPRGFETRFRLDLLGRDEAIKAVVGPTEQTPAPITLAAAGILVGELSRMKVRRGGKLVEEPGPYVEPVQLQVACYRLWEKHHAAGPIGEELVRGEAGNVDSALADFYAAGVGAALTKAPNLSERRIREWCEQRLITAQGTRGQVQEGEETDSSLPEEAIGSLIDARIVRADERRGLTWYELAHDRLIEPVRKNNSAWGEASLQPWQHRAALYEKQRQSSVHSRSSLAELLLTGPELAAANRWADSHAAEISNSEIRFLSASGDREKTERDSRRLSLAIRALATVSLLVMTSLLILALQSRNRAEQERIEVEQERTTAEQERAKAEQERTKAQRLLVVQSLTRGLDLCKQNNTTEGMHWLVRSLEQSETLTGLADSLEPLIRKEISAWSLEIRTFKTLFPHDDLIVAVAFSPDGQTVLTGTGDGTARLWDVKTGQPRGAALAHKGAVWAVAFSPDGQTALTGSVDQTARLWDVKMGQPRGAALAHKGAVWAVAFSPDGQTALTGSEDQTARLWDVPTGQPRGPALKHDRSVNAVAFSPNGQTVLTGSKDKTARLWEMKTGQPRGPALEHDGSVNAVAFSPDGLTALTGSKDKTARLWEVKTGLPRGPALEHDGEVNAVAFTLDGQTALTGSDDKTARLWEVKTGQPRGAVLVHDGAVNAVALSPDGQTALTGTVGTARLWEVKTGQPRGAALEHAGVVMAVAFSPDGQTALTGSTDNNARLWDVKPGQRPGAALKHAGVVKAVAFSPDGQTALTGSVDQTARLWDVKMGQPRGAALAHKGAVWAVAFSPDGQTALTGSEDQTARLWDVPTGQPRGPALKHDGSVNAVAFSPNGQTVLTGSKDKTARLWEMKTGQPRGPALEHDGSVNAVAFSPDGQTALTGSFDKTARLWDVKTGQPRGAALEHGGAVEAVAFSPDGQTALTGGRDKTARLWNVKTGQPRGAALAHEGYVVAVAFSPDGQTALTGSFDKTARLWDVKTGQARGPALKHAALVMAVAFSPDGQTALTGSADGTARLQEVNTGLTIGPALAREGYVSAVAFSPDGQTALTASADTARLWFLPRGVDDSPERLRLWVEVMTWLTMDEQGGTRRLKPDEWKRKQEELNAQGGPPEIGFPGKAPRQPPARR